MIPFVLAPAYCQGRRFECLVGFSSFDQINIKNKKQDFVYLFLAIEKSESSIIPGTYRYTVGCGHNLSHCVGIMYIST